VIQSDEHLLTVLRYIEANPLRAKIVKRADDYRWSSYLCHGLGAADELLDSLVNYEELAKRPDVRQRKWAQKVHTPIDGKRLAALRRSVATGLPYGERTWVERLAKRLELDLTIRARGRPKQTNRSRK
jgi:putative transposase